MVRVPEPAVVVGDVHGQYFDLVTLLSKNKEPGDTNFVFLGDYVDRGIYGVEIMLLLLSIKVSHLCLTPLPIVEPPYQILHAEGEPRVPQNDGAFHFPRGMPGQVR